MSTLTVRAARAELVTVIKTAWEADALTVGKELLFPGVPDEPPEQDLWGRVTITHVDGGQATLAGDTGTRRYERVGFVTTQLFAPTGSGLTKLDDMAQIILDAFEGKTTPGGIWFRNVRVNPAPRSGKYEQQNVVADFLYDQLK